MQGCYQRGDALITLLRNYTSDFDNPQNIIFSEEHILCLTSGLQAYIGIM